MRNFFDNIPLDEQEDISEERLQNIKNSVLSRVKEEKAMSKKSTIRMMTIAVAAATTAALSAMIASAEQPAWTPATDVEYTVDDAAETDVGELPGEAAFKEYIEKAKAEDDGTSKETHEPVNVWRICINKNDFKGMQFDDDTDAYDAYYDYVYNSNEDVKEKLDNCWVLIYEDADTIHLHEAVFTD